MENYKNSSLWGHYGANHTGVCLKFRTERHGDKATLSLNGATGFNEGGSIVDWFPYEFEKISYTNELVPLDFFDLLPGGLPIPTLKHFWYYDNLGVRSNRASSFFDDAQKWRSDYYATRRQLLTRKSSDWEFESEYRLILQSNLLDFSSPSSRKMKYNFNSLEGVIFGIKTPISDKLAVVKIIEEKCRSHRRTDFKFFQAYYSPTTGSIEQYEMSLLKFDVAN